MKAVRLARCVAFACSSLAPRLRRPAHAYDPATTHAGLTERAALASELHRVLARRLARPLGLFEPIALTCASSPTVGAPRRAGGWRRWIPSARLPARRRRRRARAGLGDRRARSSRDARRAGPELLLRSAAAAPACPGGRALSQAGHAAAAVRRRAAGSARLATGTHVQPDRPAVDGMAACARQRRRPDAFLRPAGGRRRRRDAAARGHRAGPRAAGAGRHAGRPRGRRRTGARSQRLPRRLSADRRRPSLFDRGSPFERLRRRYLRAHRPARRRDPDAIARR